MSNILTGFNMQGNDPIDNRIVSPSKFETLEEYLQRVPIQKRYYGLSFYALDENNELRHYTFQTSLIEPTIDDDEEEIERLDKELQEHVNNKEIHKTSEEIRSEIVDADIPDTIARVQWTLNKIEEAVNTVMNDIVDGASDEYNTLKKIQDKIVELRAEMESQLYGDDGGEVLKTLEQALKFLNQYKDFMVDIPDNYVNKQDIVDNLNTDDPTKVLSARQGKVLSETLTNYFGSAMASIRAETNRAINAENRIETKLDKEIDRSIKEDQRIDAKLDAEIKRSTDEDLRIDSKLDAEIERSTNEDIRIDNKLDSEINRSTAEDDRLDQKIDAETTRATTAESNLNTKIETETDRAEGEESRIEAKLDNEITRSTNKDTEHDNRLQALEGQTHEQNTDLGTTNSTFQLKYNTGNKIKHESDAISVRNAADTDYVNFIAKNATFKGDLLVEGQSFVTEAETVEIKDNLLLLNKGEVGAGVTKGIAGLEIDRGTEPNYFIIFDESDNRFKAGVERDLWNLALRESDDNMLDGYFISWNSKDKILSTTNIVNESTPLLFGRTDYKQYSGNRTDPDGNYSSYAFISEAEGNHLYNFSGSSNWNIDTDKINFRFWKPLLGTTFKRASDNSEVLYHADIVNNLTSGGTNKVLSAEQGKLLQNSITSIQGSYLPLSGGTMKGSIRFPAESGIIGNADGTSDTYILRSFNNRLDIGSTAFSTRIISNASDLLHHRLDTSYKIWDAYNLPTPASTTDLANYLPLTGGTLSGNLTINTAGSTTFVINNNDTNGSETFMRVLRKGTASAAIGFRDSIGAYIYNYNSKKYLFIDNDGYARVGTTSGSTRLALITDIPTVSGYLPLSGGTMSGSIIIPGNSGNLIITANETSDYVKGISFTKGSTANSAQIGYHSTGGDGTGSIVISPYPTSTSPWNGDIGLFISKGSVKIDNVPLATQNWVTSQGYYKSGSSNPLFTRGVYLAANAGTTGGWAGEYWVGNSSSTGATGVGFGGYGNGDTPSYAYIGVGTNLSYSAVNNLKIYTDKVTFGNKTLATVDQIPTIPSISITTSGSGSVVTGISASGHTLTVTKGSASVSVSWNDITGKPSSFTPSVHTHTYLSVLDNRSATMLPNNNGYRTFQTFFNKTDMPSSDWYSGIWVNGWASTHSSWQLCGYSGEVTPSSNSLYFRSGINSTWNSWKRVAFADEIPTRTSDLTNNSGFLTSSSLSGYATQSWVTSQGYLTSSSLSDYATQTWVNNKNYAVRESDNVLISHSNEFNFTASSNTFIAINYRGGSGSYTSAAITEYRFYNGQGSYSNVNIIANSFTGSLIGNASSATKLGSSTVGGTAKPIYLSSGTATACSATVGSSTVPVYMSAGTITQCSTTLGVSITGNAATATTATNSNNLGGYAAATYVKSTSTTKVQDIQVVTTAGTTTGVLYIVLES